MPRIAAVVAVLSLLLAGCGAASQESGTVTVFAASSLTDVFGEIAEGFEAANPGTTVELNVAASSALAAQINEGAPADVFAAASPATMKTVSDAGNVDGEPVVFVRNQLVIAVEKGNPRGITGLADLTAPGVSVALCAEQVPCGAAAKTAIASADLTIIPVSYEENVRAALSKVSLGEVDAALVYRTDAAAADTVDAVEFPESANAMNDYLIAVLNGAPNAAGARAFVAYVRSAAGAAILSTYGFQRP